MKRILLLIVVLLMMGFLANQAYADREGHRGFGGGTSWRGEGEHHGGVAPWGFSFGTYGYPYAAPYVAPYPYYYGYPGDNAFRVYPYEYYYGYAYPRYVVPRPYYYPPRSGLYFRWGW